MNKTFIIIRHEFLARVKKKSFIITSILGPVMFALMMAIPTIIAQLDATPTMNVAVVDNTNNYGDALVNQGGMNFETLLQDSAKALHTEYKQMGYDAFIVISDDPLLCGSVKIYSESALSVDAKMIITNGLEKRARELKISQYSNQQDIRNIVDEINKITVQTTTISLNEHGEESENSSEINMLVALVFAMLIYLFVLIYGSQVMRGVMEEKTNRIIEVMISSVKPFQLMMGKVIGIALVAFAQFAIWGILSVIIISALGSSLAPSPESVSEMQAASQQMIEQQSISNNLSIDKILSILNSMNIFTIIALFVFYFVGGYLIYASLFAALGAAIDNDTDGQQFNIILISPLMVSIYIAMIAFRDPNCSAAFWFSMIPFTSPIVMMARVPFQIPTWEICLSMAILVATFIVSIWIGARIYRTGILMYGKKITFKELIKWFRQAQ